MHISKEKKERNAFKEYKLLNSSLHKKRVYQRGGRWGLDVGVCKRVLERKGGMESGKKRKNIRLKKICFVITCGVFL